MVLNPAAGIAVFEIKDWSPSTLSYRPKDARDDSYVPNEGQTSGRGTRSPVAQALGYKDEIHRIYSQLPGQQGIAATTPGVIFTRVDTHTARQVLPAVEVRAQSWPQHHPHRRHGCTGARGPVHSLKGSSIRKDLTAI